KGQASPVWANEKRLDADDLAGIAAEARAIGARGTGMTGGDPMYDPERTLGYIRFLKQEFGPKHHIHMYTQIPFDPKWIPALAEAGLDELRFHPPEEIWADVDAHPKYARLYKEALASSMDIGFEIPCIPGFLSSMEKLVGWLVAHEVAFINLNEMEFSETNYVEMLKRGMRIRDDVSMSAMESADVARALMAKHRDQPITIHFCSSPFKDAIQLRERLRRRAQAVARPHEVITDDGTLLRGVVDCPDPAEVAEEMREAFDIPADLIHVRLATDVGRGSLNPDERTEAMATTGRAIPLPVVHAKPQAARDRLEVAPWVLEEIAEEIPFPCYLSEVYPTADELEVERTPLNGKPGVPDA
ncbi:MAG TPA: hypothetical protein VM889_09910, partial [Candidatus Thermoplasmatota archaeon]|nr:hypothetical protein [Candidatus Thermoplasmatota archaeon]